MEISAFISHSVTRCASNGNVLQLHNLKLAVSSYKASRQREAVAACVYNRRLLAPFCLLIHILNRETLVVDFTCQLDEACLEDGPREPYLEGIILIRWFEVIISTPCGWHHSHPQRVPHGIQRAKEQSIHRYVSWRWRLSDQMFQVLLFSAGPQWHCPQEL